MERDGTLTRADWIIAALAPLAEAGVDGVRVEALARRLKTSKGSFYWHFRDRADLLDGLLALWESEGTGAVIAAAAEADDPAARLRHVLAEALRSHVHGVSAPALETALRAWAGQDATVAARIRAVDTRRTAYLRAELMALGQDAETAQQRADALYLALVGLYLGQAYAMPAARAAVLEGLLETLARA